MNLGRKSNTLVIAVGEAGSNIARNLMGKVDSDYLFIKKNGLISDCVEHTVEVNVNNVLNPSPHLIRKAFLEVEYKILQNIHEKRSVVVIGNLASNFGSAILPILGKLLSVSEIKQIICFAILPFTFEKRKIFRCGVSLELLSKSISNLIVIDNSAILRNGIEVELENFYETINQAVSDIIIESFQKSFPCEFNLITTNMNRKDELAEAFVDTMSMLANRVDLSKIEKCSLYIYQKQEDISVIRNVMECTNYMMPQSENELSLNSGSKQQTKCHLMVNAGMQIISSYDPLDKYIAKRNILDFEPEIAISEEIHFEIIKNLE